MTRSSEARMASLIRTDLLIRRTPRYLVIAINLVTFYQMWRVISTGISTRSAILERFGHMGSADSFAFLEVSDGSSDLDELEIAAGR